MLKLNNIKNPLISITKSYKYQFATITNVYTKLRIRRMPQQVCSFLIENSTTISQLKKQVQSVFTGSQITVVQHTKPFHYLYKLGFIQSQSTERQNIKNQVIQTNQNLLNQEAIGSLIMDRFSFVQERNNAGIPITYGVQIANYSQTNNLNLPDYISQNILRLNDEWINTDTFQSVVGLQSISKQPPTSIQEIKQIGAQCQMIIKQLRQLNKLENFFNINRGSAKLTMQITMAAKLLNFGFLFGITYGLYGWDLGQPVSYLTNLSVDLLAMMGLYKSQQAVQNAGNRQKNLYFWINNINARKNILKWRLAHQWKTL